MTKAFKARYEGKCASCHDKIEVGAAVRWDRTQKGVIYHDACTPSKIADLPVQAGTDKPDLACIKCGGLVDQAVAFFQDPSRPNRVWHGSCPVVATTNNGNGSAQPPLTGEELEKALAAAHKQAEEAEENKHSEMFDKAIATIAKMNKQAKETGKGNDSPTQSPTEEPPLEAMVRELARQEAGKLDKKLKEVIDRIVPAVNAVVNDLQKNGLSNSQTEENQIITIEVKTPSGETKTIKGAHPLLAVLVRLVGLRKHVYLYGEPGSGKSTGAHMAANALNLKYAYISLNPQTSDTKLMGYMDAMGRYVGTPFRDCYENGGLYNIDELDNAAPNLVTTLNSALANGSAAFPDGMIKRHENFVLVATGNTPLRGGNSRFPERRPADFATLDRFVFLEWGYDEHLEKSVTLARNADALPWLKWIRKVRSTALERYPKLLVSPRSSFDGADLLKAGFTPEEVAEMVVFRGIDRDTKASVLELCPFVAKEPKKKANQSTVVALDENGMPVVMPLEIGGAL